MRTTTWLGAGALLFVAFPLGAAGQPPGRPPTPNDTLLSPEVLADRRVTFVNGASLNVTLGITVKEIVDVTATAQAIDTEKSEVSEVIETRKITDLPVSGRDFIDFVLLTPRPTSAAVRPSARNHRSLRPCSKSVSAACAKLIAPSSLSTALITPPAFPVCSTSVLPRIGCRNSG